MNTERFVLDKSILSVTSFAQAELEDRAYWFSLSPQERMAALEQLRQINYNYDPATDRIQRVLEIDSRL